MCPHRLAILHIHLVHSIRTRIPICHYTRLVIPLDQPLPGYLRIDLDPDFQTHQVGTLSPSGQVEVGVQSLDEDDPVRGGQRRQRGLGVFERVGKGGEGQQFGLWGDGSSESGKEVSIRGQVERECRALYDV